MNTDYLCGGHAKTYEPVKELIVYKMNWIVDWVYPVRGMITPKNE